ncbi:MAG TPA: response regulator [Gammaproteobacteria bacterium]|nr:response regulator [Gammaproteobacteria bacterium]
MSKVLIVDDSPTDVHVMRTALEKGGFEVISAKDGETGLALAREERPDAVIMDVVMPGVNGYQATRQLTHDPETASIPVVFVTGKEQPTDRVWGMRQGAVAYLTKPVTAEQLVAKIREITA